MGGGEIFFRKASIDKIVDTNRSQNKTYSYEIIKNRRYTNDKYLLHFPVQILGRNTQGKFNEYVNSKLKEDGINIIGIDRGEKHLLYYSVINLAGKIIKQGSLNSINGKDYSAILQIKQDERNKARLDWEEIGNIKNFKEWYLSQAVHEIYQLIIEHNAIIVLEDLNSEFKLKRSSKVEKSVYKKFEKALAKKLNHLVIKDRSPEEIGGVLNAYQLTPEITAQNDKYFESAKQWGVMFYVRANYTSTTDPLTGWRKHIYISNSANRDQIKKVFLENRIQIDFDSGQQCYTFSYITNDNNKTKWKLYAYNGLERFRWNNKDRKSESYNLFEEMNELFKNENLNNLSESFDWKRFVFTWNLLNQIRNTDRDKEGNDNDFIQSPIYSKQINGFFDSRKIQDDQLPRNGDSNGAYNIAKKGALLVKKIRDDNTDLYISDQEWDKFAQNL